VGLHPDARRPRRTSRFLIALLTCGTLLALAPIAEAEVFLERIASGLRNPTFLTTPPNSSERLFITEKETARIRIFDRETRSILITPFLTVSDVTTSNERGLLGLAFHPEYESNGFLYVNMTGSEGATVIRRYTRSEENPALADPSSGVDVLSFSQPQSNHNGGWLGFGPDGYLYIGTGDGGNANDTGSGHTSLGGNAQDITDNLLGKILRIDIDNDDFPGDPNRNYAIPTGNPFVDTTGDDEIWAYGLRNPWRCSFDLETEQLWIADVGQNVTEEINVVPVNGGAGSNFGWRLREGTSATPTAGIGGPRPTAAIDPVYEYEHGAGATEGFSITGGHVYRGPIPELRGHYFFGDFLFRRLWSLRFDGSSPDQHDGSNFEDFREWNELLSSEAGTLNNLVSFGEDGMGNLFLLDYDGDIFELRSDSQDVPGDSFSFYATRRSQTAPRFQRFGPVTVNDRLFGDEGGDHFEIARPSQLGLPANRDGESVTDEQTALRSYRLRSKNGRRFVPREGVVVSNVCGTLAVDVLKPTHLLLPASFAIDQAAVSATTASDLDHYLCYRVKQRRRLSDGTLASSTVRDAQVDSSDAFEDRRFDLRRPSRLCVPIAKSGTPTWTTGPQTGEAKPIEPSEILNAERGLLCFATRRSRTRIEQFGCNAARAEDLGELIEPRQAQHQGRIGIQVNDQFGSQEINTVKETAFCLPTALQE
jgi:glucose/arabinose dehydrogenase